MEGRGGGGERSEGREKCASDACYCFTLDSYTPTLQSTVVKDGASRVSTAHHFDCGAAFAKKDG